MTIDPNRRVRFDKVVTPEPSSSLGLLALGTLGVGTLLKRRQKADDN